MINSLESKDTYHIFYNKAYEGLLLCCLPHGAIAVYDYHKGILDYIFKADTRYDKIVHSMLFSTSSSKISQNYDSGYMKEDTIFWVTDRLTIYKLNPNDMLSSVNMKRPQKLKFPNEVMINQMQKHPNFPLLFVACNDGLIRYIFNSYG